MLGTLIPVGSIARQHKGVRITMISNSNRTVAISRIRLAMSVSSSNAVVGRLRLDQRVLVHIRKKMIMTKRRRMRRLRRAHSPAVLMTVRPSWLPRHRHLLLPLISGLLVVRTPLVLLLVNLEGLGLDWEGR